MMNRILIILSAFFLLVSCQKDACVGDSGKSVLTYTVQAPFEFEIKSTSNGQGSQINALWYGVYHKKADGRFVYMSDMSAYVPVDDASQKISVPITLFKDQEYKIIFVAQHIKAVASVDGNVSNCYTYIIDDMGRMSLNPEAVITDGEQLDAFVYWEPTGVIKNDYKKKIELRRPLAQINISTSATEKPSKIDVAVSGTAVSYSIFEGTYSEAAINPISFTGLACSGADLATVYVLPAGSSVSLDMTMHYAADGSGDGSATETKTLQVQGVSVAPNYKTNITGNI